MPRYSVHLPVVRVDAKIVLVNGESFVAQSALLKIDKTLWVEWLPHKTCLEVKVRTCAASCVATVANYVTSLNNIVLDHSMFA